VKFLETIEKPNFKHLKNILIFLGIFIPVTINLIFIFHYSVNTIYWDAWNVMFPLVVSYFEGNGISIEQLFSQANESRGFFPLSLLLSIALTTNYNTFFDSIAAWIILLGCLFVIWRLLIKTNFPLWLLIPSSWLLFSLSSYHSLIFGYSGVHWFLSILTFLGCIYFINRLDESRFFIIPAIVLGFISTFSYITGLLVWPIAFLTFFKIKKDRWKLLFFFALASTSAYVSFFYNWIRPSHHPDPISTTIDKPFEFLIFIPTYLGNNSGIFAELLGKQPSAFMIGMIILIIFFILLLLSFKYKISLKVLPWIQISLFSILVTIVTAGARHDLGIAQSLASRYAIFPNLALVGIGVLSFVILSHAINKKQSGQKLWKLLGLFLIVLLAIYVISSDVSGLKHGQNFHQRLYDGTVCLVNYEFSTDDCIGKIAASKSWVAPEILEKFNIGPFADTKFIKYDNKAIFQIMQQYPNRMDLQEKFPKAKNGELTKISIWTNSTMDNLPLDISNISNHKYGYLEKINDHIVLKGNTSTKISKTSMVSLVGWGLSDDKGPVDFVYVYVDGIPFSLVENGKYRLDVAKHFGNTGTINIGGTETYVAGLDGQSFDFDGSTTIQLDSGLVTTNAEYSITAWVKKASGTLGPVAVVYGEENSSSSQTKLMYWGDDFGNGNVKIRIFQRDSSGISNNSSFDSGILITNTEWHHIAWVQTSATSYDVYVDGAKIGTKTGLSLGGTFTPNSNNVGSRPNNSQFYTGQMDDVQVFDYKLTGTEVTDLFNSFSSTSPFTHYQFENNLSDKTNNGKNTYQFSGYTEVLSFDNLQLGCHEIDIILFHNSELTKISNKNTICLHEEN